VTDKLKQSETEIRVVWRSLCIISFENKQVAVQDSAHNISVTVAGFAEFSQLEQTDVSLRE
jgi:hypothetical protein